MISDTEAQELAASKNLITVGMRADEVRRQLHGIRTTFVRVFEIHVEHAVAAVPPRTSAGEFRIVGTPKSLDAGCDAVRAAKALAQDIAVTGFSLADLAQLNAASSLDNACRRLREAGLDGFAEAPLDALGDPAGAITAAREAGLFVMRLTVNTSALILRIGLESCSNRSVVFAHSLHFRACCPLPRRQLATTM